MRLLPRQPAGRAAAVITDPPYGIAYQSTKGVSIANDDAPYIWWLREAHRVTRDGGALLCFHRWDVADAFKLAIESAGWTLRSQVVWNRCVHGMGDTRCTFAPQHELIWFATKGRFRFPGARPKSVYSIPYVHPRNRSHPHEKPVQLMQELVEAITKPGDLVIDPFTGSGPTGEACKRAGRRFLGIELDPDHARHARARLRR